MDTVTEIDPIIYGGESWYRATHRWPGQTFVAYGRTAERATAFMLQRVAAYLIEGGSLPIPSGTQQYSMGLIETIDDSVDCTE